MTNEDILNAARRSEQALSEQIGQWESLDFGVAFVSPQLSGSASANQLRDVWLASAEPGEVFDRAEAYYRERNLICRRWTPASGQDVAPLDSLLSAKSWRRKNLVTMGWTGESVVEIQNIPSLRILPARAMPKAYRHAITTCPTRDTTDVDIGIERLNDSRYEAFLAVTDDGPVGRAAYLEVGDIARLADFCVIPQAAGQGAELELISHFLGLVRRLMPRITVACIDDDNDEARDVLEKCGFAVAGALPQFDRP